MLIQAGWHTHIYVSFVILYSLFCCLHHTCIHSNIYTRSVYWRMHLHEAGRSSTSGTKEGGLGLSSQQLVQDFLDHPNVLMMLVSGHHNITHPKLISMPLGPSDPSNCTRVGINVIQHNSQSHGGSDSDSDSDSKGEKRESDSVSNVRNKYRKQTLLLTAGSNYKFRPAIRECVGRNMGHEMVTIRQKIDPDSFLLKVRSCNISR